ncbi:MAG: GTP-binding protein [Sphingomonas sp.]|nr:GTP-binding protein [Sphingomonas sp.]
MTAVLDNRLPVTVLSGFLGAGELAKAGHQITVSRLRRWWAAVPKYRWPDDGSFEQFVLKHWDPVWGDRRQELVFFGIGMDEAAIRRALDACLVEAEAFTPELWRDRADPFPSWEPQPAMATA